jgi:hypothetical protein
MDSKTGNGREATLHTYNERPRLASARKLAPEPDWEARDLNSNNAMGSDHVTVHAMMLSQQFLRQQAKPNTCLMRILPNVSIESNLMKHCSTN